MPMRRKKTHLWKPTWLGAFLWLVLVMVAGPPAQSEWPPFGEKESYWEQLEREVAEAGVEMDLAGLLEGLAHHPDRFIRADVATVLAHRGATEAVGALLRAARTDDEWWVRRDAAVALHTLGRKEGIEILRHETLEGSSRLDRLFTAQTLAQLGDSSGYEVVMAAIDDGWISAIDFLADFLRFEELNALETLTRLVQDENTRVRDSARRALTRSMREGHVKREELPGILKEPPKPSPEVMKAIIKKRRELLRLKLEAVELDPNSPRAEELKAREQELWRELKALASQPAPEDSEP